MCKTGPENSLHVIYIDHKFFYDYTKKLNLVNSKD